MYQALNRIQDAIYKFLLGFGMAAMAAATLLVFIQTVLRYLFGLSYDWGEEIVRYLIISSAYFFSGPMLFHGGNVAMDIFVNIIKNSKIKKTVECINTIVCLVVAVLLLIWGIQLVIDSAGQLSVTKVFPMGVPYSFLPIGMLFSVFYLVLKLLFIIWRKDVVIDTDTEEVNV